MADEAPAAPPAEGEAPPAAPAEGEAPPAEGEAAPAEPIKHSYTLFYFNVKALAEPLRYLFAYGGIEYEDVRVTRDEWPALKPSKSHHINAFALTCIPIAMHDFFYIPKCILFYSFISPHSLLWCIFLAAAMPMGQMPVLEVDGKRVHQSISMARFLAKTVGLCGATPWEDLQIDIVVDTINDFRLSSEQCVQLHVYVV